MGLKDAIKKDIDSLRVDELIIISEQIKLVKGRKRPATKRPRLEEIQQLTATSKSSWADDVIKEREERG